MSDELAARRRRTPVYLRIGDAPERLLGNITHWTDLPEHLRDLADAIDRNAADDTDAAV